MTLSVETVMTDNLDLCLQRAGKLHLTRVEAVVPNYISSRAKTKSSMPKHPGFLH